MSLEPRSDLLISALFARGESLTLMLGAHDSAANNIACCVFDFSIVREMCKWLGEQFISPLLKMFFWTGRTQKRGKFYLF